MLGYNTHMKKFNKDRSRAAAKRFRTDISAIIYNSLVHDAPKWKVYGLIKREIAYFSSESGGFGFKEKGLLWSTSLRMYTLCSKQAYLGLKKSKRAATYQERLKLRSIAAFDAIKEQLIDGRELPKAENLVMNRLESAQKDAEVREMLKLEKEDVFYLCDVHEPCAKDHAAWQGRVYIRADWELLVDDPEEASHIRAYLHNHPGVVSVEWVLGLTNDPKSPYLVRRPNCKHKLTPVSTEQVLGASVKKLLIRNKLIHKHEEVSYNDPIRFYRAYRERLDTLRDLYDIMPNEKLGKEIKETNSLVKKWARLVGRA